MLAERRVIVRIREGLHARPATQFVKLAKGFACDLEVIRDGQSANAKSSVKLMLLGVKEDDQIVIRANGSDAETAVELLSRFVAEGEAGEGDSAISDSVGDTPPLPRSMDAASAATGSMLIGIPASEGVAIGPVFALFREKLVAPRLPIAPEAVAGEIERFRAAREATIASLAQQRDAPDLWSADIDIIDALIDVSRDVDLEAQIVREIEGGIDAASAVMAAGDALAAGFEQMPDAYIQARAEDIRAVTRNVALALLGRKDVSLAAVPDGAVIVAEEISAWDFAKAPLKRIAGIVCIKGAATSHLAIMARTHAIPAVTGLDVEPATLAGASLVALDGGAGQVALDPDEAAKATFRDRLTAQLRLRDELQAYISISPHTSDGRAIEVAANLGSLAEIEPALKAGAMGVGLFRTELLFMERKTLPSEEEQARIYRELADAFAPHPVIVRTLDIGGDKPVAGIDFPHEDNPFLGWRGVRMCLDRPDIFKPQLKALLRASVAGNIKVMVPMIADVDELRRVKALIAECRAELTQAGIAHDDFALGVMMETPAAALLADDLAQEAAFFSIGTNDLTQYVMAADRLNPRLAALNRPDHPAVMRAIGLICDAAKRAGIWVGVCGEAAARPDLIPRFVAMGVTELSMSPASIPRAKKAVTEL